ncbi:MAG TPA: type II toxin-antitoxin system ParD family antitoxin [Azospirillaceae bacterium]|nr:type II toxin-antitoxin system ParD family antitoxin [Azospirillaceae bacterium]HRQ81638.1 type II toxin-antitoxin system ParD family antitoxin [Azospirillaceae bacterium]
MAADHSDRAAGVKAGAFDLSGVAAFANLKRQSDLERFLGGPLMAVHPVPRFSAAPAPTDAESASDALRLSALRAALAEGENSGPPETFDVERFLLERRAAE